MKQKLKYDSLQVKIIRKKAITRETNIYDICIKIYKI